MLEVSWMKYWLRLEVEVGGAFVIVTWRGNVLLSKPSDKITVTVYNPTSASTGVMLIRSGLTKDMNEGPPLSNPIDIGSDSGSIIVGRT